MGLESGYLGLAVAQMKDVFEPIVQDVLEVRDGQVQNLQKQESVSAILLVGGFGTYFASFTSRFTLMSFTRPVAIPWKLGESQILP